MKNYPEGAPVNLTFTTPLKVPPFLIKSIKGTHECGTAITEWVVDDPQQKNDNLKLTIDASTKVNTPSAVISPILQNLNVILLRCYMYRLIIIVQFHH
jgi:hypothetical protein